MSTPDQSPAEPPQESVRARLGRYLEELTALLTRNNRHRDRLDAITHRISVSGTRGKSTLVRWLHDELVDADYETYAKITGTEPLSIYGDQEWIIPRGRRTTLYENEREIRRFYPMDAIVIENQGITPYTTRLVNTRYVKPTVVVVTNVREDHLDTLESDRERVVRALARTVPSESHVICGEQGTSVRQYFATELDQRGATVTFVDVPAEYARVPGAELVYCLNETMRYVDGQGIGNQWAERYLDALRVEWQQLPEGQIFDAAAVNDVQSTEAVRRSLVGGTGEVVQPFVYLRRDRPGRTASFIEYLNELADQGSIEQARIMNGHSAAFQARTSFPVVVHSETEAPDAVLSAALADGWPVMLMGNANPEYMAKLREVIATRSTTPGQIEQDPQSGTIETAVGKGTQTLILDRSPGAAAEEICLDLVAAQAPDRFLLLALEQTVDECLDTWQPRVDETGADSLEILSIGAQTRATTAMAQPQPPDSGTAHAVDTVTIVEDMVELGTVLETMLGEQPSAEQSICVCFDSVSQLIADHSLELAFRILHLLTNQLTDAGVTAHYHLSMEQTDEQPARTLAELFDTVITINEDGEMRTST